MATVWSLDSAKGAWNVLGLFERLRKQQPIQVDDDAYVCWPVGGKRLELIFLVPLLGLVVWAAVRALRGSHSVVAIATTESESESV